MLFPAPFVLNDGKGVDFHRVKAQRMDGGKTFVMKDVSDFTTNQVWLVPDMHVDVIKDSEY